MKSVRKDYKKPTMRAAGFDANVTNSQNPTKTTQRPTGTEKDRAIETTGMSPAEKAEISADNALRGLVRIDPKRASAIAAQSSSNKEIVDRIAVEEAAYDTGGMKKLNAVKTGIPETAGETTSTGMGTTLTTGSNIQLDPEKARDANLEEMYNKQGTTLAAETARMETMSNTMGVGLIGGFLTAAVLAPIIVSALSASTTAATITTGTGSVVTSAEIATIESVATGQIVAAGATKAAASTAMAAFSLKGLSLAAGAYVVGNGLSWANKARKDARSSISGVRTALEDIKLGIMDGSISSEELEVMYARQETMVNQIEKNIKLFSMFDISYYLSGGLDDQIDLENIRADLARARNNAQQLNANALYGLK